MKSQFYHEIQVLETFPKKRKKPTPHPQLTKSIHPPRCRPSRSENRSMINSVDMRTQPREPEQHSAMLRSRPLIPTVDIEHCAQWVDLKCIECQSMRAQHSKKLRELQMKFEEQLTQCKERCVMMEKKYLHKQHELISLMNDYEKVLEEGELKEQRIRRLKEQSMLLSQEIQAYQRQKTTLYSQIECLVMDKKLNAEKMENMYYFLKLYQQQTKVVLSWARLLSQIQEQAEALQLLRQQILSRKFECEVTLKQSITFEKLNFSDIPHKIEQTSFIEEDSSCQVFMKYLHHEGNNDKTRITSRGKQISEGQGRQNKQNVDYTNIATTKSLLQSRKNQVKKRAKAELESESMLRIIVMQAKTMEQYAKGQSFLNSQDPNILNCSRFSLQKSMICK